MSAPFLEGIRTKLCRVQVLRSHLASEVARTLSRLRVEGAISETERAYVFKVFGEPATGPEIPLLIGEILQHLRSCLDHLVWQRVLMDGGTPTSSTEFPVCKDAKAFKGVTRKLQGLSQDSVAKIEKAQPFVVVREAPENALIWVLHDLNRIDKHRLLLTAVAAVRPTDQLHFSSPGGKTHIFDISLPNPSGGTTPSPGGTEVGRVVLGDVYDPTFQVGHAFRFRVNFSEAGQASGKEVFKVVDALDEVVKRLVEELFPGKMEWGPPGGVSTGAK
jgi:hypothetical protein